MNGYPNTIRVYLDLTGKWRWRMKARNGLIVADGGQAYRSERHARRAAGVVAAARIVVAK